MFLDYDNRYCFSKKIIVDKITYLSTACNMVMTETHTHSKKIELLTDEYAKQILAGCYQESMSAQHISWKYSIPIAATYRRLKELERVGLIEEVDEVGGSNEAAKYKTTLERAELVFEDGKFFVKMKLGGKKIESEF